MAQTSEWAYWQAACRGHFGPIIETEPQTGYYKHVTGNPVAIWREAGAVCMLFGDDDVADASDQGKIWLAVAKSPVSHKHYVIRTDTGMWPGLPANLAAKMAQADAVDATAESQTPSPGAGHNSADLDAFRRMKAEIEEDVSESAAHFLRHPVTDKDDADKAKDWADRLMQAARKADAARLAETAPLRQQVDEINARWNGVISAGKRQSIELNDLADQWAKAETARLRKEAQERAVKELAEQRERARQEREAQVQRERQEQAKRALEAAAARGADVSPADQIEIAPEPSPEPPPPPEIELPPTVATPTIKVGTGAYGNRRTVGRAAPKTAVIVDLAAAASYLADQKHPDLIALVQRLADRAAKSSTPFAGTKLVEDAVA